MSTPFDPQPLTAAQQKQVEDNIAGNKLIGKVLSELAEAKVLFGKDEALSAALTKLAVTLPAISVDVSGLIKQEADYQKDQDLVRNLGLYLQAVQGWRAGIGQPGHETFDQLKARL